VQRVRVDYRLHRVGNEWRIYDVNANGISLVLTYRESFSRQLAREGLDALVTRLEHKNASFHPKAGG
jgi:phospholipid transport system substrate-binding protein